jgi:hypothetical protein
MAFDPDQYLANSALPAGGFNPDAYLATKPSGKIDFQALRQSEALKQSVLNDPISTDARMEIAKDEGVLPRYLGGRPSASYVQRVAAAPATRFAVGAATPFLGAGQLAMNAIRQGDAPNHLLQQYEQMKQEGGSGGPDVLGFAGNVLGPVGLVAAKTVTPAASWYGRAGQGAALGTGFGVTAPVTNGGENYWSDKGMQTGGGALIGGAIPLALDAATGAGRFVRHGYRGAIEPFFQSGRNAAEGRNYNALAGDRQAEIAAALRQEPSAVPGYSSTAAERVSALPPSLTQSGQAEFAGGQANVAPSMPSINTAVTQAQNTALANHLRSFGGNKEGLNANIEYRDYVTGPMREEALSNANIAGVKVPELQGRLGKQQNSLVSALQNQGQQMTDAAQLAALAEGRGASNPAQIVTSMPRGNFPPARMQPELEGNLAIGGENGLPRVAGQPKPLAEGLDSSDYTAFPILQRERPEIGRLLEQVPKAQSAAADFGEVAANRRAQAGLTQYQLDSLAAHGHYPLDAGKVVGSIDRMLATPGDRAVTLNQKILSAVRDKIAGLADKNGVINSRDLYAIRKTDINDVVEQLTKDMGASTKNRAATLVSSIKTDIDNAIEAAGGTGWNDYLKRYAGMSKNIDQQRIGQALEEKLTGALQGDVALRPQAYAAALRDSANVAQKSSGAPRYTSLEDALTPQNMQTVNNVGGTLANQALAKQLSTAGSTRAAALTGTPDIIVPPTISRTGMALRFAARLLQGKGTSKIDQEMARDMLTNPSQVSKLMEDAMRRAKTNEQMVQALRKYSPLATQGAVQAQGQ